MTPLRHALRSALLLLPAFALAACGSSREQELSRELAETKAALDAEIAARKQAELQASSASRNNGHSADLDSFYANEAADENAAEPEGDRPPPIEEPAPAAEAPVADSAPVGA